MSITERPTIDAKGYLTAPLENGGCVKLSLFEIFEAMTDEDRVNCAKALTWGPVLQQAVERLTGESHNWNAGDDSLLTFDVVSKLIDRAVGPAPYFYDLWHNLDAVRDAAKLLKSNRAIYWNLYHDERYRDWFAKWAEENNVESQYGIDIDGFKADIEDRLKQAVQSVETYIPLIKAAQAIEGDSAEVTALKAELSRLARQQAAIA